MDNVGAHHDLRLKAVEQQKHHHDDAARSDRSDAHEKARYQADKRHPCERLNSWRLGCSPVFDLLLEKQESRDAYQQNTHSHSDKVVHSIAMQFAQMV